ncbi:hypothetical protein ACQPU1_01405 [Clostridium paraputrificum]|uniref:hypothetical protein n=1 Tax=Clostridium paraputrificum TaxID=29363 RepID=UPI003D3438CA
MLKVEDKVKLIHYGITTGGCVERRDEGREGVIWLITDNYISIQFDNYKESVNMADILTRDSSSIRRKEWGLYKRVGQKWIEVKEEDVNCNLSTEKTYKKEPTRRIKHTTDEIKEMYELRKKGMKYEDIGLKFGIGKEAVRVKIIRYKDSVEGI